MVPGKRTPAKYFGNAYKLLLVYLTIKITQDLKKSKSKEHF